jgi:hypothetical protein
VEGAGRRRRIVDNPLHTSPPTPCSCFPSQKSSLQSIPTSSSALIIPAIALAGTRLRTGYSRRAAVPGWSHNGVRLGDEPLSPALEPGTVRRRATAWPVRRLREEHWRARGNRASKFN